MIYADNWRRESFMTDFTFHFNVSDEAYRRWLNEGLADLSAEAKRAEVDARTFRGDDYYVGQELDVIGSISNIFNDFIADEAAGTLNPFTLLKEYFTKRNPDPVIQIPNIREKVDLRT